MSDPLYVTTDSEGVEHGSSGVVHWHLPGDDAATVASGGHVLVLRSPVALLDVLEEAVYLAEPVENPKPKGGGLVEASSARLLSETSWNAETATRSALDCAEHILGGASDVPLADGTSLAKVISDARAVLDGVADDAEQHMGYFARLVALHRLHHERSEMADVSLGLMADDEHNNLDALDDPAYTTITPLIDAVLAAIEVLHHHLYPGVIDQHGEKAEEHEDDVNLDRTNPLPIPTVHVTPFGSTMSGGGPKVLRSESASIGAREAARHPRMATLDRHGKPGETAEQSWQGEKLGEVLKS